MPSPRGKVLSFPLLLTAGDGSADYPSSEVPFRLEQSAQRRPLVPAGPVPAQPLAWSSLHVQQRARLPVLPPGVRSSGHHRLPHSTPPPPRGRGWAEKHSWARPRVGNKRAQAKRVTHRTRTGTRAPGVADPAGPGAGLKPSWVSTLSSPWLGGGTISVPWGHAATSELGGHSGPWGLQPYQRTDVRDPQECAE